MYVTVFRWPDPENVIMQGKVCTDIAVYSYLTNVKVDDIDYGNKAATMSLLCFMIFTCGKH